MADGTLETTVRQFSNQTQPESIQVRAITYHPDDIIKVDVIGSSGTQGEEIVEADVSNFQREPLEWFNSHQTFKLKFYLTAGGFDNSPEVHVASLRSDITSNQLVWNSGGTDWNNATSSDNMAVDGSKVGLASTIPDSVVAQYKFEDDSDTTTEIDTLGANDANLTGPTYSSNKKVGSLALSFDGTDDELASQNTVDLSTSGGSESFSLCAWVYPRGTNVQSPIGYWRGTDNAFYVLTDGDGNWRLLLNINGSTAADITGSAISTDSWAHIYAEATQSNIKFVIDNATDATGSHNADLSNLGPMTIRSGYSPFGGVGDYIVDDYHIADDVLSSSERQTLIDRA